MNPIAAPVPDRAARFREHAPILAAILLVFLLNCSFIAFDRRPFAWDEAWYAEHACRLLDRWADGGLRGAYEHFRHAFGIKAPLIILLPQPLLLLFGRHDFVFPLANAVCLMVANAYLAALVRTVAGPIAAATAVIVFGLMPLTACVTHVFFVEVLVTTLVLMYIYHADRSADFTHTGHSLAAGLALGLGLLAKVTFPAFVAGVVLLMLARTVARHRAFLSLSAAIAAGCAGPAMFVVGHWREWPHAGSLGVILTLVTLPAMCALRRRWIANAACATSLACWVPLLWYLDNFRTVLGFAYSASVGDLSRDYGSAELFSLAAIQHYWLENVNMGFGTLFLLALLATSAVLALLARSRAPRSAGSGGNPALRRAFILIALWIVPPLIVFTLGRNRATRFIVPLLPGMVFLYVIILEQLALRSRWLGRSIGALHAAAAVMVYLILSFGGPELRLSPFRRLVLSSPMLTYRGPATRQELDLLPVLAAARQLAPAVNGNAPHVMFLTDSVHVNQNTLSYAAARERVSLFFAALPYGTTFEVANAALDRADLLVFQEGGEAVYPGFTNLWTARALHAIRTGADPRWSAVAESELTLADGSRVGFFRRLSAQETDRPSFSPCMIAYGPRLSLALSGYRIERSATGVTLTTCWLKLGSDSGSYAIAGRLRSDDGTLDANIDHGPDSGPAAFARLPIGGALAVVTEIALDEQKSHAAFIVIALFDLAARDGLPAHRFAGPEFAEWYWLKLPLPPPAANAAAASAPASP